MTKPTSADGQINNKNKQISRSEASLQGWTNEFGAEIWVENAGKTKWRVKFCSSCSLPVSTAPSATFGWCLTATGLPLFSISTSISHLHFLFFFPQELKSPNTSWKSGLQSQLDGDTRNVGLRWAVVKCKKSRSGYVFYYLIWRKHKRKRKNLWLCFEPQCGEHDLHSIMHQGLENSPVPIFQ